MSKSINLQDELANWDGVVDSLAVLYQQCKDDEQFVSQLLSLFEPVPLQVPASWLLKRGLEEGLAPGSKAVGRLMKMAASLDNWQARLHLLQCLQYLDIPASTTAVLQDFLHSCLQEDNKFIRAWAYQGFVILAGQHESFREEADALVEKAMREEAPAIKARLRNRLQGPGKD